MLQEKQEDNVKKQSSLAEKPYLRDCVVFRHLRHVHGDFGVNRFYDIHSGNKITIEVGLKIESRIFTKVIAMSKILDFSAIFRVQYLYFD